MVHEIDWNRYKVKNESPLVIVSHICSTRIPYKTIVKENVVDRMEIERDQAIPVTATILIHDKAGQGSRSQEAYLIIQKVYANSGPVLYRAGRQKEPTLVCWRSSHKKSRQTF